MDLNIYQLILKAVFNISKGLAHDYKKLTEKYSLLTNNIIIIISFKNINSS